MKYYDLFNSPIMPFERRTTNIREDIFILQTDCDWNEMIDYLTDEEFELWNENFAVCIGTDGYDFYHYNYYKL